MILFIVLLFVGAYYYVNYHNKAPIGSKHFTIPQDYKITNQSQYMVKLSNDRDELILIKENGENLNATVNSYVTKYSEDFNITQSEINLTDSIKVVKTDAQTVSENTNKTSSIIKYWFVKDGIVYDIQSSSPNVKDVMVEIINSIN